MRLVIVVCLFIIALIGCAVWLGHSSAESNKLQAFGLELCNGQPCYAGIVPNATTYQTTMRILNSRRGVTRTSLLQSAEAEANKPVQHVHVFTNEKAIVFEVDLIFRQGSLSVGDLVQNLGQPCAVYPMPLDFDHRYPYTVMLAYPQVSVYVTTNNVHWRLESASPVGQITLGNPLDEQPFDRCRGADDAVQYDWQGLRSYPHP